MPTYTAEEFYKEWRYAIDKDFVNPSGASFDYADRGLQSWGDEAAKIPYAQPLKPSSLSCSAMSDDGRYLAWSTQGQIDVFDLASGRQAYTLTGHPSGVAQLAFRPKCSTQLVSSSVDWFVDGKQREPRIIFWDLTKDNNTQITPQAIEHLARSTANALVAELKSNSSAIELSASDQVEFADSITEPIRQVVVRKSIANKLQLFGRLFGSFQAQTFNRSGTLMFYMPGDRPKSNGDDDWELRVYSITRREDALVLSGNRDSIMWVGFNPDETLIATCSWDKSFRIWDAQSGEQKFVWHTASQNWTGGFSPDGKYFAGTSGGGGLHVYNLSDGSKHMEFDSGKQWSRTLSWHPNSQTIALGGTGFGKLFVIDVNTTKAIQHRLLSASAMRVAEDRKNAFGRTFIAVSDVRYVDNGRKLALFTNGDGSAEVYDVEKGVKWRFARAGTMNAPDDDTEVTTRGGDDMLIYEDQANKTVVLATVDYDAIRIWKVPMSS